MDWRTSTYNAESGNCVEGASAGTVMIHDTQDRDGVMLTIPTEALRVFAAQVWRDKPAFR